MKNFKGLMLGILAVAALAGAGAAQSATLYSYASGGYDDVSSGQSAYATFEIPLYPGEEIVNASLSVYLADNGDRSDEFAAFARRSGGSWVSATPTSAAHRQSDGIGNSSLFEVDGAICPNGASFPSSNCINNYYDRFVFSDVTSWLTEGADFRFRIRTGSDNDYDNDFWYKGAILTYDTVRVPEPATLGLLGLGLMGIGLARRRRQKN